MKIAFSTQGKTRTSLTRLIASIVLLAALLPRLHADTPPVIPVGLDAYTMWDHWCDQRIGMRAYMVSTCDRTGGNSDPGNMLYDADYGGVTDSIGLGVPLDIRGNLGGGVVEFMRYNNNHGSPWHYTVDGTDNIVTEAGGFSPGSPTFVAPFSLKAGTTAGADIIMNPLQFANSFRMGYANTGYETGYYIYDLFEAGATLSSTVTPWNGTTGPSTTLVNLVNLSGSNLLVTNASAGLTVPAGLATQTGSMTLTTSNTSGSSGVDVTTLTGPAVIRALNFSVPTTAASNFSTVHVRITWDNRGTASVDAPISLFYGAGTMAPSSPTDGQYLVKGFPMTIQYVGSGASQRAQLTCYFPMPFFQSAHIQLVGNGIAFSDIQWSVSTVPFTDRASHVGYFHATYKDQGTGTSGKDLVLLDTKNNVVEGSQSWSGSFVGTSLIFSTAGMLGTLEGDPRFYFDDSLTPSGQGTGTEEWGMGGDYWNNGTITTLPFAGHPVGISGGIESCYRFLLADMMPFGKNAIIQLEHGGSDTSVDHYSTVVYWYGIPVASLVKTDSLQIGASGAASETAHSYSSPNASAPFSLTSQYDGGVSTSIPAATTDTGRTISTSGGTSIFNLAIDSTNVGVLLRRKLDYLYPNQNATVFIAPAPSGVGGGVPAVNSNTWTAAGTWYTAGSNTSAYANGNATVTSNTVSGRRFKEMEFLLPKSLTAGRSVISVKVVFTPVTIELYPGTAFPQTTAWSEMRYDAFSMVMPSFTVGSAISITNSPSAAAVGVAYSFTYLASGSSAATFTVTSGSLPPGLTLTTAGLLSGTPTQTGTYTGTVQADNGINPTGTQNFSITVTAPTFSQWATLHQQSADPTVTPQHDGVSNLLKYLFDINPSVAMSATDRVALPAVGMISKSGTPYLTLTYRQNPLQTGITIRVQTSTDLQTWQTVTPDFTQNLGADPATGDPMIQVQVNATGASKEFIRLDVSLP